MTKATINKAASLFFTMIFMTVFGATSLAQSTFYGDNVVKDGDFPGDTLTSNWVVEGDASIGNASVIDGMLAFTDLVETTNQYDFQINQPFTAEQIAELEKGGTFEVTFDARTTAEAGKTFHVFLGQVGGDWARYWQSPGDGDVTVTNTMASYTLTTDITQTWEAMRLGFEIATDTSSLFIDNVQLRRKVEGNILNDSKLVIGEDSISGAWTQLTSPASATFTAVDGAVRISDMSGIVNSYDVQFIQELDSVQIDSVYAGPYEMSFDARTEAESKQIQVYFGNNGTDGDWTNFAPTLVLDSVMTHYSLTVDASRSWTSMKVGFEVSADASPVWFDNVTLSRVTEIKPAAPTFSLATTDGVVSVDVAEQSGAASYDVYFSTSAIDTVDKEGVSLVGSVNAETGLTLQHSTEAPHASLAEEFTAHYAVVAKTEKGTASDPTSQSIETGMTVLDSYAYELSDEEVSTVLDAVASETLPDAATLAGLFPDGYVPFTIDQERFFLENGTPPESNEDLSSKTWMAFGATNNELIIYAEITDEAYQFPAVATGAGAAWAYDSWEMGIGNYSPSFLTGSSHQDMLRGENPDYQLRAGIYQDGSTFIFESNLNNAEIQNSATIAEETDYGYRLLTLINTSSLSGTGSVNPDAEPDVAFDFPTGTEVTTYPFNFALNDSDETNGARERQVSWSNRAGGDGWWNTPAKWQVIAFVGKDAVATSNDDENTTQPLTFSLEQNYPNPFNPSTNINFTLPSATQVTLEVFNMLGQKVATLIKNESMSVGNHSQTFDASNLSSGLYIYRISTGSSFVQSKKMMLIK
jgi:hypothetical protein